MNIQHDQNSITWNYTFLHKQRLNKDSKHYNNYILVTLYWLCLRMISLRYRIMIDLVNNIEQPFSIRAPPEVAKGSWRNSHLLDK